MLDFPIVRTLIVPPSQLWSAGATAAWAGAAVERYPASRATDGSSARATRSVYTTDQLTVTLSGSQTPNIFGVLNHNIDYDLVAAFSAPGLLRGAAARRPSFWLDLRGFPVTTNSFTLAVNGNSRPITIGELVIATGFEFDGVLRALPDEDIYAPQERGLLEYGKVAISASGSIVRTISLELVLDAAQRALFEQVADEAGLSGDKVIIVPDSRKNDIWFVNWPDVYEVDYPKSDIADMAVRLTLTEENGGVV
jgi:hypothetical protein